jgi:hypothetical protein
MHRSFFVLFALPFLLPGCVAAQASPHSFAEQSRNATEITLGDSQAGAAQGSVAQEEHRRLFWIIPTYAVSSSKSPTALSSARKFHLSEGRPRGRSDIQTGSDSHPV